MNGIASICKKTFTNFKKLTTDDSTVSKKTLTKFSLNNSVKYHSLDNILDIFEKLIVLAVEKCPRSLNLSKI